MSQIGMSGGVVPKFMSFCQHSPGKLRVPFDTPPNHKERDLDIVLLEQLKQLGSVHGVRTIVDGDRHQLLFCFDALDGRLSP